MKMRFRHPKNNRLQTSQEQKIAEPKAPFYNKTPDAVEGRKK
jgi:hypothetical protein